jgi:hypothetical protein
VDHAGAVEQNVHPAELSAHLPDDLPAVLRTGHVTANEDGLTPFGRDLVHHRLTKIFPDVRNAYLGPLAGEENRRSSADSGCAPGDDRSLS